MSLYNLLDLTIFEGKPNMVGTVLLHSDGTLKLSGKEEEEEEEEEKEANHMPANQVSCTCKT